MAKHFIYEVILVMIRKPRERSKLKKGSKMSKVLPLSGPLHPCYLLRNCGWASSAGALM
jgi:hypothetical protein